MALGGGFELALSANIRWAHSRAVFGFPEYRHGLISAWGGTQLSKMHIPQSLSMELHLSGMYLGSEAAYRGNIISKIFTGSEFHEKVESEAKKFVGCSFDQIYSLKRLLYSNESFESGLKAETQSFLSLILQRKKENYNVMGKG
jgi:enoyl-CoA hydratase/carnithine racemase